MIFFYIISLDWQNYINITFDAQHRFVECRNLQLNKIIRSMKPLFLSWFPAEAWNAQSSEIIISVEALFLSGFPPESYKRTVQ